MRRECIAFLVALTLRFTAGQLDLSFIDPFYYLYNLQHSYTFNNLANLNPNNNANQQLLDSIIPEPLAGCISTTNSLQGTCLAGHECKYSRGANTGRGNCTFSHLCCTYTKTCNETVRARVVYFVNPPNPRAGPTPCTLHLQLLNRDICQLRVDIMQLDLQGAATGTLTPCQEYITIDPAPLEPIPQICGPNTNTHFYVHLNPNNINDGVVDINVILGRLTSGFTSQGTWNMRITQLECPGRKDKKEKHKKRNEDQAADDFGELAPAGCSQYFTQPTGVFKSFGQASTPNSLVSNLDYAACFKRFPYTCGVTLTNKVITLNMANCPMILMIPQPLPPPAMYCDPAVMTPTTSNHEGPLYIDIDTSMIVTTDEGFSFMYDLTQPCPPT